MRKHGSTWVHLAAMATFLGATVLCADASAQLLKFLRRDRGATRAGVVQPALRDVQADYAKVRSYVQRMGLEPLTETRLTNMVEVLYKAPSGAFRAAGEVPELLIEGQKLSLTRRRSTFGGSPDTTTGKPQQRSAQLCFVDTAGQMACLDPKLAGAADAAKAVWTTAKAQGGAYMGHVVNQALDAALLKERGAIEGNQLRGLSAAYVVGAALRSVDDNAPLDGHIVIEPRTGGGHTVNSVWYWSTGAYRPSISTSDVIAPTAAQNVSTFQYGSTKKEYRWGANQPTGMQTGERRSW